MAQAKTPLKDAAAVNSTRWKLFNSLKELGLPVITGTGGQTKFNRTQQNLPKTHWLDAAMVGNTPKLKIPASQPLLIKCTGHGNRQMCGTNKHGFPTRHRTNQKIHKGFQTGDIVKAVVTKGKKIGDYVGRVLCRASGSFDISTNMGRVSGISSFLGLIQSFAAMDLGNGTTRNYAGVTGGLSEALISTVMGLMVLL